MRETEGVLTLYIFILAGLYGHCRAHRRRSGQDLGLGRGKHRPGSSEGLRAQQEGWKQKAPPKSSPTLLFFLASWRERCCTEGVHSEGASHALRVGHRGFKHPSVRYLGIGRRCKELAMTTPVCHHHRLAVCRLASDAFAKARRVHESLPASVRRACDNGALRPNHEDLAQFFG